MQLANYLQKEGQLMLLEFRVSNYKSFKDDYQIIKGVKYHLDDMECVNDAIKNVG